MNQTIRSLVVTVILIGTLVASGVISISTTPGTAAVTVPKRDVPAAAEDQPEQKAAQPAAETQESSSPSKNAIELSANLDQPQQAPLQPIPPQPVLPQPKADNQRPLIPVPVNEGEPVPKAESKLLDYGVTLSSDGLLSGRLDIIDPVSGARTPGKQLTVNIIKQGSVISQAKPSEGGIFQIAGLVPGVYSIVAMGMDGFFARSILVRPTPDLKNMDLQSEPEAWIQIKADLVQSVDVPLVRLMIRERMFPTAEFQKPFDRIEMSSDKFGPRGVPVRTRVLKMDAQGRARILIGRIDHVEGVRIPSTNCVGFLLKEGVIAGRAVSDSEGQCEFSGVKPGDYALLVVPAPPSGKPETLDIDALEKPRCGYAALGVTVVGAAKEADSGKSADRRQGSVFRLASAMRADETPDSIDLIPTNDIALTNSGTMDGTGMGPGGGVGGMYGSPVAGGGGGGGGGLGGGALAPLLITGGIAGILAAANGQNGNGSGSGSTTTIIVNGGGGGGGGTSPSTSK